MSVEVADSNGPFAQVASNNGFQDLVNASQSDPVLKTFFYHAATEDTKTVAEHLRALQARDDIEQTAKGMASAIDGHEFVILTRGESADVPDGDGIADPEARKRFNGVLKAEGHRGTIRAHLSAFKTLQDDGYQRKGTVWIEKDAPAASDVHINRPMGAIKYTGDDEDTPGKKKRKKERDKDDPGTQDVTPYGMDKREKGKEKDDPGTQDVGPDGDDKLALPLPKYQPNQFNNAHKVAKQISGSRPIPLNSEGTRLATKLGKRIHARGGLDVLGSSTLKRGKQTAQLLSEQNPNAAMASPTPALVPWRLGDYEGRMPGDVMDFIRAYIENPNERPPGKSADGERAETFNEAAKRQLKYFVQRHKDWEADPTMKLADVVHSRGLELLKAYVDSGADSVNEFLQDVDTKELVEPDDPEHNALLVWKKNKIKELDPEDNDPLEGGYYLILHGLTDDDTDDGNADVLDKHDELDEISERYFQPPYEVCKAAQDAVDRGAIVEGITDLLASGVGLTETGVRKVAEQPTIVDSWGGTHAKKWANKILLKLAKNNGHRPWVAVDISRIEAAPQLLEEGKLVKVIAPDSADVRKAVVDAVGKNLEIVEDVDPGCTRIIGVPITKQGSGLMVAFYPDAETQNALAVKGGEPADSLHVTLAYFGKQGELEMDNLPGLMIMLSNFAGIHAPVSGTLGGLGRFPATPQSDGQDVIYMGVHIDGIQQFRRELVEATNMAGFAPKDNFGFNPHMTLQFVSPHAPHLLPTPDPVPVTFDKIVLANGGAQTEFPLTGTADGLSKFEIEGSIVKADDDKKQVFGWASIISINGKTLTDTQGDRILADTLEAASYDYVLDARKGGEMHKTNKTSKGDDEVRQVAKMIESCVFTKEKQKAMQESLTDQSIHATIDLGCVAWWIGFQITDPDVWKDVKSGKLRAFSIGGKGKRLKTEG